MCACSESSASVFLDDVSYVQDITTDTLNHEDGTLWYYNVMHFEVCSVIKLLGKTYTAKLPLKLVSLYDVTAQHIVCITIIPSY